MPGCGKSYFGRLWGRKFHYHVEDLDRRIEHQTGLLVQDIFSGMGEKGFRTLEADALLESIQVHRDQPVIIVTGGGTPTYDSNMGTMLRSGLVVYLRAESAYLLVNILRNPSKRPLLKDCTVEKLDTMLEERRSFYERAHMIVDVERSGPDTFAEILKQCTNQPL